MLACDDFPTTNEHECSLFDSDRSTTDNTDATDNFARSALERKSSWGQLFTSDDLAPLRVRSLQRYVVTSDQAKPFVRPSVSSLMNVYPCPSVLIRGWTSARVRTKPLEFFCQPVKFDCPITAKSWAAICCPPSTASTQVGKSSRSPLHRAAACPLHPLH